MKLKEYLKDGGLFSEIATLVSVPVITINEALLDTMLLIQFGEREVFSPYETITVNAVASMVALEYESTWLAYIEAEAALEGLFNTVETTVNKEAASTETGDRTDTNKVSAYNSEDLLNKDGSESTTSDTRNNTEEIVSKVVEKNLERAYSLLSSKAKVSVTKMVLNDVAKFLTLDVY